MSRALTPLDVIATDICADLGDSNGRYKFSILRKLMAGWRELSLYVDQSFSVKTAVLQVDNVIELPCDFVFETKVGIKRNGHIAMMTLNNNIQPQSLSQEETECKLNEIWEGQYWGNAYPFYNWNGGLGELYGVGGVVNVNGYYNIDRAKGEVYIGSLMPQDAELVIEYKSNGTSDGLELIPTQYWNCLKYYALSEWFLVKDPNKAQLYRSWYEREYNKNQRLNNYKTALFMANTIQSMYVSSPR